MPLLNWHKHCDNGLIFKNIYEPQVSLKYIRSAADQYLCLFHYDLLISPFQEWIDIFMQSISPFPTENILFPPTLPATSLVNFRSLSRVYSLALLSLVSSLMVSPTQTWAGAVNEEHFYSSHLCRNTEQNHGRRDKKQIVSIFRI